MRPREDKQLPFLFSRIVPVIAAGIFFWVIYITLTYHKPSQTRLISLDSWQQADAAFGIPADSDDPLSIQIFDPHFHFLSVWERGAIPRAHYLEAAMGSETWATSYDAQPFDSLNTLRGGKHSGDDINGIGGKNSDLGDAVFAIGDGLIIYRGTPSPGWGKCIVIAHQMPDGRTLHSMYAHLSSTAAPYHSSVARGQKIGTVGSAGGKYWAHLHLEIRESPGVSPFLSGYPTAHQFDRISPSQTISQYQAPAATQLAPSVLRLAIKHRRLPELEMDLKSLKIYHRLVPPKKEQ